MSILNEAEGQLAAQCQTCPAMLMSPQTSLLVLLWQVKRKAGEDRAEMLIKCFGQPVSMTV